MAEKFKRKLLESDYHQSIFKLVIFFKSKQEDGSDRRFEMYSKDWSDERHGDENGNAIAKPAAHYNGFIHMVKFIAKVAANNDLKKAMIYANRKPERPLVKEFNESDFLDTIL